MTEQPQLCWWLGDRISSCLCDQSPDVSLTNQGLAVMINQSTELRISLLCHSIFLEPMEGVVKGQKFLTKSGPRGMYLVIAVTQIKSTEMPTSSLVAQDIGKLPDASSWTSALPSSNDKGYLFCCVGCLWKPAVPSAPSYLLSFAFCFCLFLLGSCFLCCPDFLNGARERTQVR